jgi:DNA-binding transcriptional LysR family regulator
MFLSNFGFAAAELHFSPTRNYYSNSFFSYNLFHRFIPLVPKPESRNTMDIPNIRAFLAVADTSSFSLAAERLYLTQPAVSKRITALESELGTTLFDRIGRQVTLTEAGRTLFPRARQIVEAVEDSRRVLSNLSDRVEGQLTFGTSHHIGLHHLPPVLRAYAVRYPQVELDIRFMESEEASAAVAQGELELALATLPATAQAPLVLETVWDDPLAFAVAANHPLASEKRPALEKLAHWPAVLPKRGTVTRELVEELFAEHNAALVTKLSTNYLETIKMLVSVGLGWSVLPQTMLDESVVPLHVPRGRLKRRLGVVHHKGRTLSNAGRAMLDVLTTFRTS